MNEKREANKRLQEEINDPEVANLTLEELQDVNYKLAEDVRVIAERFPRQSPTAIREGNSLFKEG